MTSYWARTLRGIEDVATREIETRHGGRVTATGHRDVLFEAPAAPTDLRTVDDVFVMCGTVPDVGTTKDALGPLADAVAALDLPIDVVRSVRALPADPVVEVVASFLGSRTYSRYDVEDAIGETLPWPYRSRRGDARPDGDLVVRLHIAEDTARVGVRLGAEPLRRRPWLVDTVPGSLHPPLAAALVLLAEAGPGDVLWDPCCGAGTIPIEALALEPSLRVVGSDLDPDALEAARRNGLRALARADAARLPLADGSVQRIVSNVPWGQTVRASGMLALGPGALVHEIERVLAPGGRAVVVHSDEEFPGAAETRRVAVFGTWATVSVLGAFHKNTSQTRMPPGGGAHGG